MKKNKKRSNELLHSRVKMRFRKHILPPLAGLLVAVLVFVLFNSELLSAKIYYLYYQRHTPVVALDTTTANTPIPTNTPPELIIDKIKVNAPVDFSQKVVNQAAFLQSLHNGVVHYPDTAFPGQQGNVVIFGHSSGQLWAPGHYKFVFTLLDKLQYGDLIFLDYKGVRYIYRVNNSFVVSPSNLSVLNQGGSHMLTLITCTPVGTNKNRLIIQAQQILPKTTSSTTYSGAATLPSGAKGILPSSSASFWNDLRELF